MTHIVADLEAFELAEAQFKKALEAYEEILERLDHDLRGSLAEWAGDARTTYNAAHQEWARSAKLMSRAIADFHRALQRAHRNFRAAHEAHLRMWHAS
ncbi:WXG100 family type VII secretion target [Actinomadura opuntiae]|uniref:WXG100 family type VII secretion target n=1 Tax=Actinomadura sp. OS1-43 TaxID=604315 RepID=UPI00255A936F|nr:WXG100 family type VII secretion target [Actinomadura sp. OS1-43]MDL4820781.1 WXG100 family type VII secretion target [Actinomadura sp. OS1-43]